MAAGKHRALNPHRNKVGNVVAAGAVPLVLAIVGSGAANAAPSEIAPVAQRDDAPRAQWPAADAPNVNPYEGMHIPSDTKSSIQWSRQAPDKSYLAPVGVLHAPVSVPAVPSRGRSTSLMCGGNRRRSSVPTATRRGLRLGQQKLLLLRPSAGGQCG
ncbi:hypothetical protein [Nocardia tengchongensis]